VPLYVGKLGPRLIQCRLWAERTSVPSGILIYATVWPQYTNVTDRHRTAVSRTVELLLVTVVPGIWTKVMETESKQKTPSHSASSESLYLGRRKPLPVSQIYFRWRDNHFRFDRNRKYCRLNSQGQQSESLWTAEKSTPDVK